MQMIWQPYFVGARATSIADPEQKGTLLVYLDGSCSQALSVRI